MNSWRPLNHGMPAENERCIICGRAPGAGHATAAHKLADAVSRERARAARASMAVDALTAAQRALAGASAPVPAPETAAPAAREAPQMVIRIDLDAGIAKTLWNDELDLPGLGTVKVTRASHVEYDDCEQAWYVDTPNGVRVASGFKTRGEALAWEGVWAANELRK